MSNFTLIGSRYVFCDGKHVCTIICNEGVYAPPLLKKLNEYSTKGFALMILDKMIEHLSEVLRKPTPTDERILQSHLNPKSNTKTTAYGSKHICTKCGKKFYDLHGRITGCPVCERKEGE